MKPTNSRL